MGQQQFIVNMKAFVAILSCLAAVATATSEADPQLAYNLGAYGYPYGGYGLGAYGYAGLAVAAPLAHHVAYAAAPAAFINPYDYAGQVYPAAEPYIHAEVAAEPYVHEDIAAEPYVHED